MIIERTWTREVAGDKVCLNCKQKAAAHRRSMHWITLKGENVGRARIITANGCIFADWVEEWEDAPSKERATKRMKAGRDAEGEFKDYHAAAMEQMPGLFAVEDQRFREVKVFEKADDYYGPAQTAEVKTEDKATVSERKQRMRDITDEKFLNTCSKANLEYIRKAVLNTIKRRFRKNNNAKKYGGLNRGFTEEELTAFFSTCNNERARTMFLLMRYLGLRVGEVVRLQQKDLDLEKRYLYLETEKAQQPDCLYLHDEAYDTITAWMQSRQEEIKESEYLFPGMAGIGHNSPHWLAKEFREIMQKTKINYQYGFSSEGVAGKKARPLYRLTSHSFRHTFIRNCWEVSHDPMLVSRMARHKNFGSTQVYLQVQQADMDRTIIEAFSKIPIKI